MDSEKSESVITKTELRALFANLHEEQVVAKSPRVINEDKAVRVTLPIIGSAIGAIAMLIFGGWQAISWFHDFRDDMREPVAENTRAIVDIRQTFDTITAQHTGLTALGIDLTNVIERVKWLEGYTKNLDAMKEDLIDLRNKSTNDLEIFKRETQHLFSEKDLARNNQIRQLERWNEQQDRKLETLDEAQRAMLTMPVAPRGAVNWNQLREQQGNYDPDKEQGEGDPPPLKLPEIDKLRDIKR